MKGVDTIRILEEKSKSLRERAYKSKDEAANLPDGYILCKKTDGKPRLYRRIKLANSKYKDSYLGKADEELKRQLAKRMFLEKMTDAQIKSAELIDRSVQLLKQAEATCSAKKVLDQLPEGVEAFVDVSEKVDQGKIEKFMDVPSNMMKNPHKINTGLITKQGEEVRSKSELIIANMLFDAGIPYHYELILAFDAQPGFMDVVYPDFTAMNIRTGKVMYWEHFGMMDNQQYFNEYVRKMENYSAYGYLPGRDVILSFETAESGLRTKTVAKLIEKFLK
jgi:hypothetical protein